MAKRMAVLGLLLVFIVCLLIPAKAFFPFKGPHGDLWDAMVDPFKVFEHILDSVSKDVEDIALAQANWKETLHAHVFTFDVPGIKKDEIKIEVGEKGVLTISGQRVKEEEKEGEKWHRVERAAGKFLREFTLPGNVNMDNIEASLDNGVLTISVPKINKIPKIVDIVESTGEL